MNLRPLHHTVILIDVDYLNQQMESVRNFYTNLYSDKTFSDIPVEKLMNYLALDARINAPGEEMDILFAYRPGASALRYCRPGDVFEFIDVRNARVETGTGNFRLRSFFADEGESTVDHFINMFKILYFAPEVKKIVLIADDPQLNGYLEYQENPANKEMIMIRQRKGSNMDIGLPWANIDYPLARAMGLGFGEM